MGEETLPQLIARGAALHLMGIAGAGMAGLALLARARGAQVSGCDQDPGAAGRDLERGGIKVVRGHSPDHVAGCAGVVYTAAVPESHPELVAARARGVRVVKRSQALAELVNTGMLVAIAGTHGKTTTTTLTALALEAAGADPTALVGGRVPGWGGNARLGRGDTYVVEADEYDRSFLALWPRVAVVTSVEAEHLDTYGTCERMEEAFDEFVGRVPQEGRAVICVDDAGARRRLLRAGPRGVGYGLSEDAALRAGRVSYEPDRTRFTVHWRGTPLGDFELALRGVHNVRNALAAIGVLLSLDLDPRAAASVLAGFTGVERRFQVLGTAAGVTIVDDYAHHPTEVAATLATARQAFAGRRLVVAFQPHLYSRTRAFASEFGRALAAADFVLVTGIYPAREAPLPGVSGSLVADAARAVLGSERVRYAESLAELSAALKRELRAGDVFVTLGAGNIGSVAHALHAELGESRVDA